MFSYFFFASNLFVSKLTVYRILRSEKKFNESRMQHKKFNSAKKQSRRGPSD